MNRLEDILDMKGLSTSESPMRYKLSIKKHPNTPWYKFIHLRATRKGSMGDKYESPYTYFEVEIPFWMARYIFGPLIWGRKINKPKDIHFPSEDNG